MQINNKYEIGDKALCLINNKIEKITIGNFHLDYDTSKSLEDRLMYEIKSPVDLFAFSIGGYTKTKFLESELFDSVDDLINDLKNKFEI